jgi:hypothetical protein
MYTLEVPQPTVFNQVFTTKADVDKTIVALKELEENTDCKIVKIKIQ